ncbi:hypothetical protein [Intestinibaculum porci]|uniref:hypothetical protein n=1 Tax=Intestinibaculum porci TaxID=2487118 RepID=UPI0011E4C9E9|nr:hypothetical protein [Intestinibaculum porci]
MKQTAKALIKIQQVINSLGKFISLPIAVTANIASVLYIQMRMAAVIAYMGGYDLQSDKVQTFVYACSLGNSVNDVRKGTGMNFEQKFSGNSI